MNSPEHRESKRYPFKWRVAIVFSSATHEETYRGITHDVSAGGCSVLTEHNIYSEETVSVLISLPAENPASKHKVIEARARMVYTVLSSGHRKFRCGIQFLQFKEDGRKMLMKAFAKRDITTPP